MISRIYRLMDTKRIELKLRELDIAEGSVIVKPEYMSICAADQRYYLGQRKKEVLRKKLPMALVHEATGTVLQDTSGSFAVGTKVVLIPLEDGESDKGIKSNYRTDSTFASSGTDGFLRDTIARPSNRLVPVDTVAYNATYVFSELVSVALNAVQSFEAVRKVEAGTIGVWGDGNMGFIMSLMLRCKYPSANVIVFGKEPRKLNKFSFASKICYVDEIPKELTVDHAFECVGSKDNESIVKQLLDMTAPQGVINLLGVSEESAPIETRKIIDKGLLLIGHNRSDGNDIRNAVELIRNNDLFKKYLRILISQFVEVRTENDIYHAFEQDILNDFKTVIKWCI